MIQLNDTYIKSFLKGNIGDFQPVVDNIHHMIHNKTGKGADFLGWVELPNTITDQLPRIQEVANRLNINLNSFDTI